MANNARAFCMTHLRGIPVACGYAVPCAPTFLMLDGVKFGGVVVSTSLRIQGESVPVPGGGPPTHKE